MPSLVGLKRRDQRSSSREYCWVYRYNPLCVQTASWCWGVFLSLSIFHEKEGIAIITSRLFQPAAGQRGPTSVQMPWIGGGRSWGQRFYSRAHTPCLLPPGNGGTQAADLRIRRQHSSDSVSSINSATSHSSVGSNIESDSKKKKRKNWVRAPPWTPPGAVSRHPPQ